MLKVVNSFLFSENLQMNEKSEKHQRLSEYLEILKSQGKYWCTKAETTKSLEMTSSSFYNAIHKLVKQKKIIRVRNGFYIIIPPEYRSSGLPTSHFIDVLLRHK